MIDEGVGIVDDLLFITIEGAAEPMLEVKLQMIAGTLYCVDVPTLLYG